MSKVVKKRRLYNEERAVKITCKSDIAAVNFAALAVATPTFDDYLWEYICIRGGRVTGTDRYRIHRAKLETPVEDGLYNLVKSTKRECVIERVKNGEGYPSEAVIDKYLQTEGRRVEVNELFTHLPAALVYLIGRNGQAMKPEYIIDACKLLPSGHVIVTLPTDTHCGVHIKHVSGDAEAFIMPIILDSEKIIEREEQYN